MGVSAFNDPQWYADGMEHQEAIRAPALHARPRDLLPPKGDRSDVGILDLIAFVLGTCSTIAEAKAAAATCNVVNVQPKQIHPTPPYMILHDKDSCAVVEFHPGGMKISDNPVQVATNSPTWTGTSPTCPTTSP